MVWWYGAGSAALHVRAYIWTDMIVWTDTKRGMSINPPQATSLIPASPPNPARIRSSVVAWTTASSAVSASSAMASRYVVWGFLRSRELRSREQDTQVHSRAPTPPPSPLSQPLPLRPVLNPFPSPLSQTPQGTLTLCGVGEKCLSPSTLKEDVEIAAFLALVKSCLAPGWQSNPSCRSSTFPSPNHSSSPFSLSLLGGRIDIIASAAAKGEEGKQLVKCLSAACEVPVFATTAVEAGPKETAYASQSDIHLEQVVRQYFYPEIRGWAGPYTQTLQEFEKIRVVGKGAFGAAVLYRKVSAQMERLG